MKKLFLFLILITVILVSCTNSNSDTTNSQTEEVEPIIDLNECLTDCDIDFPVESQKLALDSCKTICHTKNAKQTKNPDDCNPLKENSTLLTPMYTLCVEDLIKEVILTKDVELCERYFSNDISLKDSCINEFVHKYEDIKDVLICDQISDEWTFGHKKKDNCIGEIAKRNKDITLCANIEFNYDRTDCERRIRRLTE